MDQLLIDLRADLQANIDEHTKETSQRFFKEKVKAIGVKTKTVNKITRQFYERVQDKDTVFSICEDLFKSGILEESFVASKLAYYVQNQYDLDDFEVFERWVDSYVNNWATCDTLCNRAVGSLIEKYSVLVSRLFCWARSNNMWMRRAATVSLVIPAKKGMFLDEAFILADILLNDKEDLVQKGYGWLLKEESRTMQKEVYDFVLSRRAVMPRTALRYVIELMPQNLRKEAMKRVTI